MTEHPNYDPDHDHLDPLTHTVQAAHLDLIAQARIRAATALRDLGHSLVGHEAPLDLLDDISATLEGLVTRLDHGGPRSRHEYHPRGVWAEEPGDGDIMTSYSERPVSGPASPWGLDTEVRREGNEAVARLTLRSAHEGAPGRSHGGIVAALFDDIYGFVLAINLQPAFTGELTIRYQQGTPIGVPLECRVRQTGQEGRKITMAGELTVVETGEVVARSTALFIAIDPSYFSREA